MIFDVDDIYNIEESYKEEIEELKQRIDKVLSIIDEVLFIGIKDYPSQLEIIASILRGDNE